MKKSVFKRFLFFSILVGIICILVVFGIFTLPVSHYIEESKQQSLEKNASEVAIFIGKSAGDNIYSLKEPPQMFDDSVAAITNSLRAIVMAVDTEGQVVYSSSTEIPQTVKTLPQSLMEKITESEYFEHGTLHNIYNEQYYISAVPITAGGETGDTIGYCLVAQATLWTGDYIPSVLMILILMTVFSATLIFILASVYAYNASRPLKLMSAAAKRFAVGDFESRVYVNTNDEIGELANAFNEMADSLASSEGMRRNFVANVSHELKTPMTTIAGYIDGMLDGTISHAEQRHYLKIVSTEVKRLSRLVNSMISLSKIDSGDINVKKSKFILQDTVFSVLLGFENEIKAKNLKIEGLESGEDTIAFGDRDLIYQVLYNLVENAVKFTDEGGYIRFGFSSKGGKVCTYVENSGKGILPEDLRLVFDKFYKGDKSRSSNKNSMGLGLYIVRKIIHLHEGDITAESEPGHFCRFTFWIPEPPKNYKKLPDTIKEGK